MNTVLSKEFISDKLVSILGSDKVLRDSSQCLCSSFDSTNIADDVVICSAVVLPESTEDIVNVMKFAYEYEVPVVARGAGTNLVGACLPKKGGIVMDFSRMNRILEINPENLTATVEPGVVSSVFAKEVEKLGLYYPPDPSNHAVSTIGGAVALCSGGPHSFKYGTTKDFVIDLKVVCADGRVMNTGSKCPKNVTGYDLTRLFVGSEGTLGIISEITVKLIPKPLKKRVMIAYFDTLTDAGKTVNTIIENLVTPAVTDLMDYNTLNTIEKFMPTGLKTDSAAALLIETDGANPENDEKLVVEACKKNNASFIQTSDTPEIEEKIWIARRSSFAAMARLAPNVSADDFVVPRENIVPEIEGIKRICEKYNLKVGIMGHIADGNIHPNIALDLSNETEKNNLKEARKEMYALTLGLGGMLSGEHGIGCEKSAFMSLNIDETALSYMKAIKKLFDKKNILNPGKIFENLEEEK